MLAVKNAGRWIGLGILLGYAADIASNFWLQPGIRLSPGPIGLLEGAAQQPEKIALIVVLGLLSDFVALCMAGLICRATLDRPVFGIALTYLGLKAAAFGMGGVELASLQMMRSVGEALAEDSAGITAAFAESIQLIIRSLRNGLHFPHMLTGGFSALLLYLILMRARFIPRILGVMGLIASMAQMSGVFAGVLGREVHMGFLLPLFVTHLLLGLWLLSLGFNDPVTRRTTHPS